MYEITDSKHMLYACDTLTWSYTVYLIVHSLLVNTLSGARAVLS